MLYEVITVLAEGPVIAIHQSDEVLAGMDEWNTTQHGRSGLVELGAVEQRAPQIGLLGVDPGQVGLGEHRNNFV